MLTENSTQPIQQGDLSSGVVSITTKMLRVLKERLSVAFNGPDILSLTLFGAAAQILLLSLLSVTHTHAILCLTLRLNHQICDTGL